MRERTAWTVADKQRLKEIYGRRSRNEQTEEMRRFCAEKGIPDYVARKRASRMGISRRQRVSTSERGHISGLVGRLPASRIGTLLMRAPETIRREMQELDFYARIARLGITRRELAAKLGIDREAFARMAQPKEDRSGRFPASEVQLWLYDNLEQFDPRRADWEFVCWGVKGVSGTSEED